MKYELKQLSFGETLGQAFNLYFDNFIALFTISFLSNLPSIMFQKYYITATASSTDSQRVMLMIFWFLVMGAVGILNSALSIELISKKYLGEHQSIGQYIRNVLPFLFPIVGVWILSSILAGIGFLLFVIPGIYVALGLIFASQVLIVERTSISQALSRSFALTKGKKLILAGYSVVIALLTYTLLFLVGITFGLFVSTPGAPPSFLFILLQHAVQILTGPLSACVFILAYFSIKIEKEGFDLEHMVNQFPDSPQRPGLHR
ncbi:MAG: hypothetical protein GY757_06490 [bacterium]|nr:hypothetical protein [bacterium]